MEHKNRRAILGVIFIIIGVILLLDNFYIIPWDIRYYFFTWQMILIGIGIFQLTTGNKKGAFILIGLGVFFWIPDYMNIDFDDYWPVILIIIGAGFFLKGRNQNSSFEQGDSADYIDDLTILGNTKKAITSDSFEGGKITTMFGSADLDLKNANLRDNKANLDLFTIFGGFKAKVPLDWNVKADATCIFGSFEDKRKGDQSEKSENTLTIKGLIIFGGGEVK